jgi:hypothetical protein
MTVPLSQNALLHSRDSIVGPLHFSIGVVFKHVLFLDCQHDSLQDVQFDQDEKFPVKEINVSSLHVHAKVKKFPQSIYSKKLARENDVNLIPARAKR